MLDQLDQPLFEFDNEVSAIKAELHTALHHPTREGFTLTPLNNLLQAFDRRYHTVLKTQHWTFDDETLRLTLKVINGGGKGEEEAAVKEVFKHCPSILSFLGTLALQRHVKTKLFEEKGTSKGSATADSSSSSSSLLVPPVVSRLHEVMKEQETSEEVQGYACRLIETLSLEDEEMQEVFLGMGFLELMKGAMIRHRQSAFVQKRVCEALRNFGDDTSTNSSSRHSHGHHSRSFNHLTHKNKKEVSKEKEREKEKEKGKEKEKEAKMKKKLVELGFLELLKDALVDHPNKPSVHKEVCDVLFTITSSSPPDLTHKVIELGFLPVLRRSGTTHQDEVKVQRGLWGVIHHLSLKHENGKELRNEEWLGTLLRGVMSKYRQDSVIQQYCCSVIGLLSIEDKDSRKFETSLEEIVNAMTIHSQSIMVQTYGTFALFVLCSNNESLVTRFDVLTPVKHAMANFSHTHHLQQYAIELLFICAKTDRKRMVHESFLPLIKSALSNSLSNEKIQEYGVSLLCGLTIEPENRECLMKEGLLEVIQNAMAWYFADDVLQLLALRAIRNLSCLPQNRPLMTSKATLMAIKTSLMRHPKELRIQRQGIAALNYLTKDNNDKGGVTFMRKQLLDCLKMAMTNHSNDEETSRECLSTLENLTFKLPSVAPTGILGNFLALFWSEEAEVQKHVDHNKKAIGQSLVPLILSVIKEHQGNLELAKLATSVLFNISTAKEVRSTMVEEGVLELAKFIMKVHSDSEPVQRNCTGVINHLTLNHSTEQREHPVVVLDPSSTSSTSSTVPSSSSSSAEAPKV